MSQICPNQQCPDYAQKDAKNVIRYGKDRNEVQRYLCKTCGRTFINEQQSVLESWQRKKAKKGLKSRKNQPELYDEVKQKQTLSLTPTAIQGLDRLAAQRNISRSELVERVGREIIPLALSKKET